MVQNIEEQAIQRSKQLTEQYIEYMHKPIYVGNGILDQIKKPAEAITITVEDLYNELHPDFWWILDSLFVNRPDLKDRIEKYKNNTPQL